jgi:hypothetical protein
VTVVLCSWSGRLRTQHDCHQDTKVKPEAATAVIELLMMGGETPETYWALNKSQDNKLKNFCIWLVIYLNCRMMHELTNLKYCILFITLCNSLNLFFSLISSYQVSLPFLTAYNIMDVSNISNLIHPLLRCECNVDLLAFSNKLTTS